jgi:ABC-type branched-subunit amino acid transport system substrate-binding protein
VIASGLRRPALLNTDGQYDLALRNAFEKRFVTLGGQVGFEETLPRNAQSYDESLSDAVAAGIDSILLSTSARSGALVVNGVGLLTRSHPRWFLSPLLKTDVLLQNVIPAVLEGAVGVAPRIYDASSDFPNAFAERWSGELPLEGAYFYYDALALAAFALEKAPLAGGRFEAPALRSAILSVAGPPGEAGRWNEIGLSLSRLRGGGSVYYTGLTGPMFLESCGNRQVGASSTWQVHDGRIEPLQTE